MTLELLKAKRKLDIKSEGSGPLLLILLILLIVVTLLLILVASHDETISGVITEKYTGDFVSVNPPIVHKQYYFKINNSNPIEVSEDTYKNYDIGDYVTIDYTDYFFMVIQK